MKVVRSCEVVWAVRVVSVVRVMRGVRVVSSCEVLVSNSSLVSGLSEASRARFSWVEVSQEKSEQTSRENKNTKDKKKGQAI